MSWPDRKDSYFVLGSTSDLADGQTYTIRNIKHSDLHRGSFGFGTAKIGSVADGYTLLDLRAGKYKYYEREW